MLKRKRENISKTPEQLSPQSKGVLLLMKLQNAMNESDYKKTQQLLSQLDIEHAEKENKKAMTDSIVVVSDLKDDISSREAMKDLKEAKRVMLAGIVKNALFALGGMLLKGGFSIISNLTKLIKTVCWGTGRSLIARVSSLTFCGFLFTSLTIGGTYLVFNVTKNLFGQQLADYLSVMVCSFVNFILDKILIKVFGELYMLNKTFFNYIMNDYTKQLCKVMVDLKNDPKEAFLKITGMDVYRNMYYPGKGDVGNIPKYLPTPKPFATVIPVSSDVEKVKRGILQTIIDKIKGKPDIMEELTYVPSEFSGYQASVESQFVK